MEEREQFLEALTADERIALMGFLWESLDPTVIAPVEGALVAELDWREAEADTDPNAGLLWPTLRDDLRAQIR